MADEPVVLESMAAPAPDETGRTIRFQVKGRDGRDVAVECHHEMVDGMIRFLVELARDAAERRASGMRWSFSRAERVDVDPLPISHTTFVVDPQTMEIVQLFRMFGFDLGFLLTPEHMSGLKKELDRILPAVDGQDHHHHNH